MVNFTNGYFVGPIVPHYPEVTHSFFIEKITFTSLKVLLNDTHTPSSLRKTFTSPHVTLLVTVTKLSSFLPWHL